MNLSGPLIVVRDVDISKQFYKDVLGLELLVDSQGYVVFSNGLCLQDKAIWAEFIHVPVDEIKKGGKNFELYFEEDDFEAFVDHFRTFETINLLNDVTEYPWGQKGVRFYDLDEHIIEVSQSMRSVVWNFQDQGMSLEEIADKIQHPMAYILQCVEERTR